MDLANFAITSNFITRRDYNARPVSSRRAFFMPESQVIDYNLLSAAYLEWYLNHPHFNFSPCDELLVGGEEGSRFLLPSINKQLIMQSKSTPQVGYTPAQLEFIDLYLQPRKAGEAAKALRAICISALESESIDNQKQVADIMFLAEMLLDVAQSPAV